MGHIPDFLREVGDIGVMVEMLAVRPIEAVFIRDMLDRYSTLHGHNFHFSPCNLVRYGYRLTHPTTSEEFDRC